MTRKQTAKETREFPWREAATGSGRVLATADHRQGRNL
jgi:hypothetical protein